jgi:SAM-dependent methyltransferase
MRNLLHVGCGVLRRDDLRPFFSAGGWSEIRYDIDPAVEPDVVGDSRDLSVFEDASFDAVYSAHNIEHVSSYEVPQVLREFRRVLRDTGFLVLLCPDMLAVAEAITQGRLEESLYTSSVGPITAIDIVYGYQPELQQGRSYMAHKMAFTPDTLARHVLKAGFVSATLVRDRGFGLTALACLRPVSQDWAAATVHSLCMQPELVYQARAYGEYA